MDVTTRKRKFEPRASSSEEFDPGKLLKPMLLICLADIRLDSGLCSIDFYAAAKDPFRVAPGNKIPMAWPFIAYIPSDEAEEILEGLQSEIQRIFTDYNIKIRDATVRSLRERDSSELHQTLLIDTVDHNPVTWKMAATDLQSQVDKVIKQRGSGTKIQVEVRDNDRMYRDVSTSIRPNTPAHKACMEVEDAVYEQVKKMCASQWRIISYHMRGRRGETENLRPTVMVRIEPGARHFWQLIEEEITRVVDSSNSQGIVLDIELLPGFAFPVISKEMRPSQPLILRDLPDIPVTGSSIGPRGTDDAGSLGLWVDFQPEGNAPKQRCLLTCYHVIASGDPAKRDLNDKYGIGLDGRELKTSITVDYPAPLDARATQQHLQWEITNGTGDVENTALIIDKINRNISAGGIGVVIYASGILRQNQSCRRMDWALVQAQSSREQINKPLPETSFSLSKLWNGRLEYKAGTDEAVSTCATPKKGEWVAKKGRSGVTSGKVESMEARVNWNNGSESRETAVAVHDTSDFCIPGDFGAMVINRQKKCVGMVIAKDSSGENSYITPIQELMDDIRTKTGGSISLVGGGDGFK